MQSSLGLIIVPETDDYKLQPELNLFLDEVYGVTSKPLSDAHSHNLPRGAQPPGNALAVATPELLRYGKYLAALRLRACTERRVANRRSSA